MTTHDHYPPDAADGDCPYARVDNLSDANRGQISEKICQFSCSAEFGLKDPEENMYPCLNVSISLPL